MIGAEAMAARVGELQRAGVPRASLAAILDAGALRLPAVRGVAPDGWGDVPADVLEALDRHLSHYAWLLDPVNGRPVCPGCETGGAFSWGIVHGHGYCGHCSWPGTAYHYVADPAPDAPCGRCGARLDEHGVGEPATLVFGSEPAVERRRPCPHSDSGHADYKPRDAMRLEVVLWAHPEEVHTNPPEGST